MLQGLQGLQHVQAALHVGGPGAKRVAVAATHQRLGCQVKHHLRLAGLHDLDQRLRFANVGDVVPLDPVRQLKLAKQVGVVSGSRPTPVTRAPSSLSQSASQLPLKPVCPVSSTRRPAQNSCIRTTPSKEPAPKPTAPQGADDPAGCPSAARSPGGSRH